jgi:hypothetical protein
MLELPIQSIEPGWGGESASSASKAAMAFSNRPGSGYVSGRAFEAYGQTEEEK